MPRKVEDKSEAKKKQSALVTPQLSVAKPVIGPRLTHNFRQVQVHSNVEQAALFTYREAKDDKNARPVSESCPLALNDPRSCPFGGACHTRPTRIQRKSAINQSMGHYEQEADDKAEALVQMPKSSASARIPDSGRTQPTNVPLILPEVLHSPGQPLDPATRAFMEARFGHDFSRVRLHVDEKAADSALAVNAQAYTVGNELVFGAGQYRPETVEGNRLLSHELTHVVQQNAAPVTMNAALSLGVEYDKSEVEAEQIAINAEQSSKERRKVKTSAPVGRIQRQLITPLGQGGGFQGLMERDRRRMQARMQQRVIPFVNIKRNNIKLSPKLGTDYGHWWTEIDGDESYGWWPDHCPVTLKETLFGTRGDLNGVKGCGGEPKRDPHHGETADKMFKPVLIEPKTDQQVRSEIRRFAMSYSGEWRWTFGWGQNCRSFQKSLMASVGLAEP